MREKRNHRRRAGQIAEAYLMGTLPPPEATAFEDHYLTCRRCAAIVEATDLYVRAMKQAARALRGTAGKASMAPAD